ncbi:unnamed protein product [Symbiodinium sp. CCMP2592]|nr:unnamed protein product [Symbiodinium sp. CCMP2592]
MSRFMPESWRGACAVAYPRTYQSRWECQGRRHCRRRLWPGTIFRKVAPQSAVRQVVAALAWAPTKGRQGLMTPTELQVGAYSHGQRVGIYSSTKQYPSFCRLVNRFIHHLCPELQWSTFRIAMNERMEPRKQPMDSPPGRFMVALSHHDGGALWLEDGQGSSYEDLQGHLRCASVTKLSLEGVLFPSYAMTHCSCEWSLCDRVTLEAFCIGTAMAQRSRAQMAGLVQMPVLCYCATVGCGRAIHSPGHSRCCSACAHGQHTRRCERVVAEALRRSHSVCTTEGCVLPVGPGHTTCCSAVAAKDSFTRLGAIVECLDSSYRYRPYRTRLQCRHSMGAGGIERVLSSRWCNQRQPIWGRYPLLMEANLLQALALLLAMARVFPAD